MRRAVWVHEQLIGCWIRPIGENWGGVGSLAAVVGVVASKSELLVCLHGRSKLALRNNCLCGGRDPNWSWSLLLGFV